MEENIGERQGDLLSKIRYKKVYEDWMKSGRIERANALLNSIHHKGWTMFDYKHLCPFCSDQPSKIKKGAYLENRGNMKKIVICLIIVMAVSFLSGCSKDWENSPGTPKEHRRKVS